MAELTIQQALEIANRQYQSGQIQDAESLYRQILTYQPNHTQTMQMLAQLAHQTGRVGEAEELLRRVMSLNPQDPDAHNNLGMVLAGQGRFDDAVNSFGRALMLRPAFPEVYNNLGNTLRAFGQLPQAIRAYQKALTFRPGYADARDNLNDALKEQAYREQQEAAAKAEAEATIEVPEEMLAASQPAPAQPDAMVEPEAVELPPWEEEKPAPMAEAPASKAEELEAVSEAALPVEPEPLPVEPESSATQEVVEHFELASDAVIDEEAEPQPAVSEASPVEETAPEAAGAEESEELRPMESESHVEPEPVPVELESDKEPSESFDLTEPENVASSVEAVAEADVPQEESTAPELELAEVSAPVPAAGEQPPAAAETEAEPEIASAAEEPPPVLEPEPVEFVPHTADEFRQRGRMRWGDGHYDEAAADLHAALDVDPADTEARRDLGLILLTQGDFRQGWPAYEAKIKESYPISDLPQPPWDGSDLANHRILLRAEQNISDAIQFIRYAPLVGKRGGRVIVRCRPELRNLLVDQPGILLLVSTNDPMPKFFTHCPLASLPRVMGTTPDDIPSDVPYLLPDGKLVDKWYARISAEPAGLKVGVALRPDRSAIPVESSGSPAFNLSALGEVSGARFYTLQRPGQQGQAAVPPGLNATDWTAELPDLAQTAALISCLDLVITTDNVVAHLAGALGRPTWLLLPFVADWRWMIARTDSPWYPTMRLFRQPQPGNWDSPAQEVVEGLRRSVQEQ